MTKSTNDVIIPVVTDDFDKNDVNVGGAVNENDEIGDMDN